MKDLLVQFAADEGKVDKVGEGNNNLIPTVTGIINAIILVLGLACVIIVIVGGIGYMTSTGDAGKVKKAKDTILYGIIGLVICVLAYAIVNFVIVNILGANT